MSPSEAADNAGGIDVLIEVDPNRYAAVFNHIPSDATIDGCQATLRFHYLKFDGNGRPRVRDLAHTLVNHVVSYAHKSRKHLSEPLAEDQRTALVLDALRLIRKRANSGEAGEMLLYFLLETVIGAPQLVAKISLKTNPKMEVHGSDGIHGRLDGDTNLLDLYLGEAKIYRNIAKGIGAACRSIKRFLDHDMDTHELALLTTHYKHADNALRQRILSYINGTAVSGTYRLNHVVLVGFDFEEYEQLQGQDLETVETEFRARYSAAAEKIAKTLGHHIELRGLDHVRFEVFFVPFPDVRRFRKAFLQRVTGDLIQPDPSELYDRLLRQALTMEIPLPRITTEEVVPLGDSDVRQLLLHASGLAFEDNADDRRRAFEICSRLLAIRQTDAAMNAGCKAVFERLGNFPGADFVNDQLRNTRASAPASLGLESVGRRAENTIKLPRGQTQALTDFQRKVYRALRKHRTVSFSAPTSSGKSFILGLELVRRLKADHEVIAYLVPTRALIRQVIATVRGQLEDNDIDVPVRSIPVPLRPGQVPRGAVFVLTQERLLSLLFSEEGNQVMHSLFVDEAHSIGDDARGLVLQVAIEAVLRKFPNISVCFGSPFVANPHFFVDEFVPGRPRVSITESLSPVTQNEIVVQTIFRRPREADLFVRDRGVSKLVGRYRVPFEPGDSVTSTRAKLALAVTAPDECTLVYANDRTEAEDTADLLAVGNTGWTAGPEVLEAIAFLKTHVHPEYPLARSMASGVATHYGPMPSIVRSVVEDLFAARKLRFVSCTSTLLHGVDLPAKHIIIHNPRRGPGNPLSGLDYKNLAGRAGRLKKELHGNVWILRPEDWTVRSFEETQPTIVESTLNTAMSEGARLITATLENSLPKADKEVGVAMIGKIFADLKAGHGTTTLVQRAPEEKRQETRDAVLRVGQIPSTLPLLVFQRNGTTDPRRLEELFAHMHGAPAVEDLMPLHPRHAGFYNRFMDIIRTTNRILDADQSKSYVLTTLLGYRWITGWPLQVMIAKSIEWAQANRPRQVQNVGRYIVDLLHTLEQDVRYRVVKNLRAYSDVLAEELRRRRRDDLLERIPPLHLFLECGTHEKTQLSMMSLGLSRTTAHLLAKNAGMPSDLEPEDCLGFIRRQRLGPLRLPKACVEEIRRVVGRTAA